MTEDTAVLSTVMVWSLLLTNVISSINCSKKSGPHMSQKQMYIC